MRLLFPNLTFEEELAGHVRSPSAATRQISSELAPLMLHLADDEDRLITDDRLEWPRHLQHLNARTIRVAQAARMAATSQTTPVQQFVPWGWSEVAFETARQCGITAESKIVAAQSVARVNGRDFNAQLDPVLGAATADWPFMKDGQATFGRVCQDLAGWQRAVDRLASGGYERVVTKPQFAHAARNRLLTGTEDLNTQQRSWVLKQLQTPGMVYVEPWVDVQHQAGLQFQIEVRASDSAAADISIVARTGLLTDRGGRYRGTLLWPHPVSADCELMRAFDDEWEDSVSFGAEVCRLAFEAGYRGPLGIDAFSFRTPDGTSGCRPCNDINARWTMGRVAVALRRHCTSDETAIWLHAEVRQIESILPSGLNSSGQPEDGDVRAIGTSPRQVNGRPVNTGSVLIAAKNPTAAVELAELIQNAAVD
ncbi:MAG: hypothetical protein Fues2KO_50030 [Fuerstiella sp.]